MGEEGWNQGKESKDSEHQPLNMDWATSTHRSGERCGEEVDLMWEEVRGPT